MEIKTKNNSYQLFNSYVFKPLFGRRHFLLSRIASLVLDLPMNGKLLDIGCYNCDSLNPLKNLRSDLNFYGVDIIDYKNNVPGILKKYERIDLEKDCIPFEKEAFDFIRMAHILEHLKNPAFVMEQIGYLLKPGGVLYVSTPNERSLFVPSFNFGHKYHNPFNFFDDPSHWRPVTTHGIYCWLETAGFKDNEIEVGIERTFWHFLRSAPTAIWALIRRDRLRLVGSVWNLVGWVSYGIARKGLSYEH